MDFVERHHVVFALRVFWVHAENVVTGDEPHVLRAKFSVFAGVTHVPRKLLGDDLNVRRIFLFGKFVHRPGPKGHRDAEQQHTLDQRHSALDVTRGMASHADIVRFRVARAVETK